MTRGTQGSRGKLAGTGEHGGHGEGHGPASGSFFRQPGAWAGCEAGGGGGVKGWAESASQETSWPHGSHVTSACPSASWSGCLFMDSHVILKHESSRVNSESL